jgi:hypothetical protein
MGAKVTQTKISSKEVGQLFLSTALFVNWKTFG